MSPGRCGLPTWLGSMMVGSCVEKSVAGASVSGRELAAMRSFPASNEKGAEENRLGG